MRERERKPRIIGLCKPCLIWQWQFFPGSPNIPTAIPYMYFIFHTVICEFCFSFWVFFLFFYFKLQQSSERFIYVHLPFFLFFIVPIFLIWKQKSFVPWCVLECCGFEQHAFLVFFRFIFLLRFCDSFWSAKSDAMIWFYIFFLFLPPPHWLLVNIISSFLKDFFFRLS